MSHTFRYRNPLMTDPAFAMRDHFIIKVGSKWFLTGTSAPYWEGSNPGVRLLCSDDLIHWSHVLWIIDAITLRPHCPYQGRFWAPEIHLSHNRFYLTVNCGHEGPESGKRRMDNHGIFLFVSSQVEGPYDFVAGPIGKPFKNDASLFTDEDGQSYLYCSGGGLWQSPISLDSGRLSDRDDLEKICSPRDLGNPDWMMGGIEGPFVIKRHGIYHLFFSAWTRGYEIGVMSAPTPLGPWKLNPRNPIFGSRKSHYREQQMREGGYAHLVFEDTPDPFVETGHCAIFTGPDDRDWISCHYLPEGKQPHFNGTVLEYADAYPQLGIEPLHWQNGQFSIKGPTWTEQIVSW